VKDCDTNLNIICCYRNPIDVNFDQFMNRLEQLLEHFFSKKCVIVGDFNINLLKEDKKTGDFLSLLACYNFRHLISVATYINKR
jgi:hypothetical protein